MKTEINTSNRSHKKGASKKKNLTTKEKIKGLDNSIKGTFVVAILVVVMIAGVGLMQMFGKSYAAEQAVESLPNSLTSKLETQLSNGVQVPIYQEYISGIRLPQRFYGVDSAGKAYELYCLERWLTMIGDVNYTKDQNALSDKGMAYLLSQIYPNNDNFLPGQDKNVKKYVSQLAIWYYQDKKAGYSDTADVCSKPEWQSNGCKNPNPSSAEEETTLYWSNSLLASEKTAIKNSAYYSAINQVVTDALAYKEDNNYGVSISKNTIAYSLTADQKYIESSLIEVTATGSNFLGYSFTTENTHLVFYDEQGAVIPKGTLVQPGKKFKIQVPIEDVRAAGKLSLSFNIKGTFSSRQAYMYLPTDSTFQKALIGTMQLNPTTTGIDITIEDPMGSVKISKTDATTGAEVPGATLVVTDSNGKEIARWVSTNEPYYIDPIKAGRYTLTETIAPEGYVMSTSSVEFEVKAGETTQVEMKNVPEIDVPNTISTIPTYVYIVGAIAFLIGAGLIYISLRPRHE